MALVQTLETELAKYDPLRDHLLKQQVPELVMTFAEIEDVLESSLPKSAASPQFWANTSRERGHVQGEAWRHSYNAFLLAEQNRVRFVRHAVKS